MQKESLKALEQIKIVDNNEPLVDLRKSCPGIFIDLEEGRLKKEGGIFVRRTVAHMLQKAHSFLPKHLTFKIRDAWRPQEIQEKYYNQALSQLRKDHPHWSKSQLRREINRWIFPPDARTPPWHTTGGAIDLTLCNRDGRSLPMNSRHALLPQNIRNNRELLKNVMEKAGFTNYALEWWHFSYGDTGWALRIGHKYALYDRVQNVSHP